MGENARYVYLEYALAILALLYFATFLAVAWAASNLIFLLHSVVLPAMTKWIEGLRGCWTR